MKSANVAARPNRREMLAKLKAIYGAERAESVLDELMRRVDRHRRQTRVFRRNADWVNERDLVLIVYGDQVRKEGEPHLRTLRRFLCKHVKGLATAVHLLPFFPYSSDDGFSVIDYYKVNPVLGDWEDIERLAEDFDLMFDAVVNHVSSRSDWFRKYLAGDEAYRDYFIEADPRADYSSVTRPRALPLLTPFETARGMRHLWTTFSEDQIDLNYANERVLLDIIDVLLFYAGKGARIIRLDAIGYLWKKIGTSCIHLEETHMIVRLFRDVLDLAAPGTLLMTETNVPHAENIRYFGDGSNEAHMVYQFPLPPLVLHAFHTGSAEKLTRWAASLAPVSETTAFFNFLASHDGIGLMPAKGILSDAEIGEMAARTRLHGGYVSYKDNGDGTTSPYELNISYFDALSPPDDEDERKVSRFAAAHAILLSLAGVPGIYFHSLFGSRNWRQGVEETGRSRSINREKLNEDRLEAELADPSSLRSRVFRRLAQLIALRREQPAFHPNAAQRVLAVDDAVFALLRFVRPANGIGTGARAPLLALVNVSDRARVAKIDPEVLRSEGIDPSGRWTDLIGGQSFIFVCDPTAGPAADGELRFGSGFWEISIAPYQVYWLRKD